MSILRDSNAFDEYLYALSCKPQAYNFYSQCVVNGVKFVTWERDCVSTTTQNSGLMVETDDDKYYGVVEDIIQLMYPHGVAVLVFKCRWFNENRSDVKRDHGLESVDTSQSFYEDNPYCLASSAKQVFYIDDPKLSENWKVVNVVCQRGMFDPKSLARDDDSSLCPFENNAYQEDATMNIPQVPIDSLHIDSGSIPMVPASSYHDEFDEEDEKTSEDDEAQDEGGLVYYDDTDDEDDDY